MYVQFNARSVIQRSYDRIKEIFEENVILYTDIVKSTQLRKFLFNNKTDFAFYDRIKES